MTRLARARRQAPVHAEQRATAELVPVEDQRFACSLPCPDGVELIRLGRAVR